MLRAPTITPNAEGTLSLEVLMSSEKKQAFPSPSNFLLITNFVFKFNFGRWVLGMQTD
jgi:hypothetical protein